MPPSGKNNSEKLKDSRKNIDQVFNVTNNDVSMTGVFLRDFILEVDDILKNYKQFFQLLICKFFLLLIVKDNNKKNCV